MEDQEYIKQARAIYGSDDIEIDDGAVVSRGSDPGAFVAAWVWVSHSEVEADEEEACGCDEAQELHHHCPHCGCVLKETEGVFCRPCATDEEEGGQ